MTAIAIPPPLIRHTKKKRAARNRMYLTEGNVRNLR